MHVHPRRGDQEAVGIDDLLGAAHVFTDSGDPPTGDGHVPAERGLARSVNDVSPTNDYVVHEALLLVCEQRPPRR